MDKAKKPDRAVPKAVASDPSNRAATADREVRINPRALILVVLAGILAIPGLFGLKALQERRGRSTLLLEARKQRDVAGRPDLALGYFNRYLELAPGDLDAIDERAALLAETASDPIAVEAAIRSHVILLGKDAGGRTRGPARKRLAELYLRAKLFRAAEQTIRDYLKANGGDVEARRLLARSLEGSGRQGDAGALAASVAEYEAAEVLEPGDVASAERLATLYLDKFGDRARALQVLDALLEHNPRSSPARLARARFFAGIGDARSASSEIGAAIQIDPNGLDARLAAAETDARRGDPTAARTHLAAIKPPRPGDLRVKLIEGQIELDERKIDQAINNWRAGLILSGGNDLELNWRLAHVLIQLGRLREAEPLLSQFRRLAGGDEPPTAYRYLVGLTSLKSGRIADAITQLESIRYKVDGGLQAPLHLLLGQAYEASMEPNKAAEAYQAATALTGVGATPWLALARLQAADRPADQIAILERGIDAIGPDARLFVELARAHWRDQASRPPEKRNWSNFDRALDRGEQVAADSVELAMVRADRAATVGRPEDGLASLEASTGRFPTSSALWLAQIEALAGFGRVDEAIRRLDRAVNSAGDQAGFRIARARLALRKGEVKAARSALVESVDGLPIDQRAMLQKALGEFHQAQGDRPAARRAFLEWSSLATGSIDPHLSLLNLAIEAGDDRSADLEVEAIKEILGPSSLPWKIARAEFLLRDRAGSPPSLDALDEASKLVAEIEKSSPRQPAGALLEARLMERRNRPDDAIQAYEKAIERKAGPIAIRPMAAIMARLGRIDELESLRSRVGGFTPEIDRMVADLVVRRRVPEEAEELVRRMVAGDPSGLDARAWQAKVLGDLGKTVEAEKTLRQLIDRRPEAPAPWVQLLMFQIARNDQTGASDTIERMKGRVRTDRPDLLWATCYRAANLQERADRAFLDALRAFPDELPTLRSAIDYYEATGRPNRAEPILRRARKVYPGLDWVRRRLALNLAGRPGDRASWLEAMQLAGEPSEASDTPDDRLTRGVVLSLGPEPRRREGVTILEALAAEMPENPKVRESLARALLSIGDLAGAREHARRAARGDDASPDSIQLAATLDLAAADPAAAEQQLTRLHPIGSDDPSTVELKARVLKAQGKSAEAVVSIEKSVDAAWNSPGSIEIGRNSVRLLTLLGEPEAAERMARKLATLGPIGSVMLAEWLGSRGRFEESSSLYESASKQDQGAREAARSALAMASKTRESRWSDLADRLLDRAIGLEPDDGELAYARASLRHLQGRLEESVQLYDELAARSPANLLFLNNCAWILSEELARPEDGLGRIEALIARAGGQPHTLDTRGVILLRLGQTDRAINDLEAAAVAFPSGPICYHLARAYLAAGRRDDAARAFAQANAAGLKPENLQPSERDELSQVAAAIK